MTYPIDEKAIESGVDALHRVWGYNVPDDEAGLVTEVFLAMSSVASVPDAATASVVFAKIMNLIASPSAAVLRTLFDNMPSEYEIAVQDPVAARSMLAAVIKAVLSEGIST